MSAERGIRLAGTEQPFIPWGVSYFPQGVGWAPKPWLRWDEAVVRDDMRRMRDLGVNCARVFLTYGSFLPAEDRADEAALSKLDRFMDLAAEHGLRVHPAGPDHWEGYPEWMARGRNGGFSLFDEPYLRAVEHFWSVAARRYRDHAALFAWDLRNEPAVPWADGRMKARWNDWLAARYDSAGAAAQAWGVAASALEWGAVPVPDGKGHDPLALISDYQRFRESVGREWVVRQRRAIRAAAPDAPVTVGFMQPSVPLVLGTPRDYCGFDLREMDGGLDFLSLHYYPIGWAGDLYEYRGDDEKRRHLALLEATVRAAAGRGGRLVIGEYGWYGGGRVVSAGTWTSSDGDEECQAEWCESLVRTTAPWACGWLNWSLYDYPEARDVTQRCGLLAADGRPKAWARRFGSLAAEVAGIVRDAVPPARRPELPWHACAADPAAGRAYFEEYLAAYEAQSA